MAARAYAWGDFKSWLKRPITWVDLFVLATLPVPDLPVQPGLPARVATVDPDQQRVLLAHHRPSLRRHPGRGRGQGLSALLTFVFVATGFVYTSFIGRGVDGYVDALYFTVTSLTTTGYGDIILPGVWGRLLSIAVMLVGVSLFIRLLQLLIRPHKVRFPVRPAVSTATTRTPSTARPAAKSSAFPTKAAERQQTTPLAVGTRAPMLRPCCYGVCSCAFCCLRRSPPPSLRPPWRPRIPTSGWNRSRRPGRWTGSRRRTPSPCPVLKGDSRYAPLHDAALDILSAQDRIATPDLIGAAVYNFWQDADHVRGVLRRPHPGQLPHRQPQMGNRPRPRRPGEIRKRQLDLEGRGLPGGGWRPLPDLAVQRRQGRGPASRIRPDRQTLRRRRLSAARKQTGRQLAGRRHPHPHPRLG